MATKVTSNQIIMFSLIAIIAVVVILVAIKRNNPAEVMVSGTPNSMDLLNNLQPNQWVQATPNGGLTETSAPVITPGATAGTNLANGNVVSGPAISSQGLTESEAYSLDTPAMQAFLNG